MIPPALNQSVSSSYSLANPVDSLHLLSRTLPDQHIYSASRKQQQEQIHERPFRQKAISNADPSTPDLCLTKAAEIAITYSDKNKLSSVKGRAARLYSHRHSTELIHARNIAMKALCNRLRLILVNI